MTYVVVAHGYEGTDLLWAGADRNEAVEAIKGYRERQDEFNERMELVREVLIPAFDLEVDSETGYVIPDVENNYTHHMEYDNAIGDIGDRLLKELNLPWMCSNDPNNYCIMGFDGKSFRCVCSDLDVSPSEQMFY